MSLNGLGIRPSYSSPSNWTGRRKLPAYYVPNMQASSFRYAPTSLPATGDAMSRPIEPVLKEKPKDRVDILHPPTIQRRTVALETDIQNQHNFNRARGMQSKMYQDYIASRKPAFYGKQNEREMYKRQLRESLKDQMRETAEKKRREFEHNRSESSRIGGDFRSRSQADVTQRQSILVKNMQYMRENKRMAEEREQFIRDQRRLELQRERELLLKTPINWSYTLK